MQNIRILKSEPYFLIQALYDFRLLICVSVGYYYNTINYKSFEMRTAKLQDQYFSSANHSAMKHRLIEDVVNHLRACPYESLLDSTRDLLHDLQDGY